MADYAVVACKHCQRAWTVEERHQSSRCPGCGKAVDLAKRRRLWQGDDAGEAREAAGAINAALAQGRPVDEAPAMAAQLERAAPEPRHDSPAAAAAAKARAVVNASQRADTVALWLTRLQDGGDEATYLEAMRAAGLSQTRAEKEIVRMLACDVIYEPRPGWYRSL